MQSKRVAMVTGANQGVGFQVAKELVANGLTVLVGSRNFERGEAAAKEIGQGAIALQLDVTDRPSIAAAAERIRKEFGRLDLLVNNAAISNTKKGNLSLQDYAKITLASNASLDEIRAVWETNVLGSAERDANLATTERRQCLQCQLPQGRDRPETLHPCLRSS